MKRFQIRQTMTITKVVEVDAETAEAIMPDLERLMDPADVIKSVVVKNEVEEIGHVG